MVPAMADTTRDWQQWGRVDPLYAVASLPERHRDGANPWTDEDFYANGRADWGVIGHHWRDYAGALEGTVLEVGCGAGRMSQQLAGEFSSFVGLDVSPDQLELARAAVAEAPAATDLRLSTGTGLAAAAGEVDGVFSTHVFQHLRPALVESLLEDCGRVLAPGGTVMLHIPIPGTSLAGSQVSDVARRVKHLEPLRVLALRTGARFGKTVPPMRFQVFDPAWVFERIERGGLQDAELRAFDVGGMRCAFFFARKPA